MLSGRWWSDGSRSGWRNEVDRDASHDIYQFSTGTDQSKSMKLALEQVLEAPIEPGVLLYVPDCRED